MTGGPPAETPCGATSKTSDRRCRGPSFDGCIHAVASSYTVAGIFTRRDRHAIHLSYRHDATRRTQRTVMTRVPGDLTSSSPHLAAMDSESFPPSMPTPQSKSACRFDTTHNRTVTLVALAAYCWCKARPPQPSRAPDEPVEPESLYNGRIRRRSRVWLARAIDRIYVKNSLCKPPETCLLPETERHNKKNGNSSSRGGKVRPSHASRLLLRKGSGAPQFLR